MIRPCSVKNSRPSSAVPNVATCSLHIATRYGGNGTTRVSPGGRFFNPRSSWNLPVSVYRLHSDHGELDCDGQESIQSCRVPVELGEGQHFLQKHAPRRVLADVVSHLMPAAVSAGIQGSWTSDVTQLKSAALGTAPALRSGSSRLRWARILASEDRPRAAGRSPSGGRDGHRTMRWTTAHTEHAASSGSCIPATMQAKPVPCEAAHRVIPKEYNSNSDGPTAPRAGSRARSRSAPHRRGGRSPRREDATRP